jgi:hypothetical protein
MKRQRATNEHEWTQRAFGESYQPSAVSHQLFVSVMRMPSLGQQAFGWLGSSQNLRGARRNKDFVVRIGALGVALGLALVSAGQVFAETPPKHIRVIVDTSMSLHDNDPNGYVKTATAMFYDLAWKLLNVNDTFKVVLFDPKWGKTPEPPESVGKQLAPGRGEGERSDFVQEMLNTEYESPWTYFSPCMYWAAKDLEKEGGSNAQKIIVLVTDGVPDDHTIQFDQAKLKALVPELNRGGIKVYILAFGPSVAKNWFDDTFQFGRAGGTSGETFVGENASNLLDNMLEIFSRSFGYTRQNATNQSSVDVTQGTTRERAVVVALYKPGDQPGFALTAPSGSAVGSGGRFEVRGKPDPHPHKNKDARAVSYAFQWLTQPAKGSYGFKATGATPIQLAVLWPSALDIQLRAYGNNPIDAVMADKPAPMEVVVSPSGGAGGDPGDIRVKFHLHYLKQNDDAETHADAQDHSAADTGKVITNTSGTVMGKVFLIQPTFLSLDVAHGKVYQGYIDIKVTRGDSETVLAQKGDQMYPVQVYPYVSFQPSPPSLALKVGAREALRNGESGCNEFHFQLQGKSNSLAEGNYTLGVRVEPAVPSGGGWRGARVKFDNQELDMASKSLWQASFPFDPSHLAARTHSVCVQVGSPTRAETNNNLTLHFGVWPRTDERYQRLNVVDDLNARVSIEAPDFWHIWRPWLLFLLTLLLMYLTYLFWRLRQVLPPDMAVSLADGAGKLTPARLGEASLMARWLGLPQDRQVIALSGDRTLGSVRPLTEELYVFVPAKGFGSVMVEENGEWRQREPRGDGSWLLEAGKRYRVGTSSDSRYFRLEYGDQRPGI